MCAKYIDLKEMETLEVDEKNHEFKFDLKEVTGHEAGIFIFADNSVSVGFWGESRECSSHYNEDLDYVLECTVTDLEEVCEQIPGICWLREDGELCSTINLWDDVEYAIPELFGIKFVGYDQNGKPQFIKKEREYNPGKLFQFNHMVQCGMMGFEVLCPDRWN